MPLRNPNIHVRHQTSLPSDPILNQFDTVRILRVTTITAARGGQATEKEREEQHFCNNSFP